MHNQPRYKPLAASDFFTDGRSERPEVEGTVARGRLRIDQPRYTGQKSTARRSIYFPFPITPADLERGQERYNIFCSPCHSRIGDGNGMVVRRGFRQAASYHTERLIQIPVGHFFDVITNGFGAMPSYASRVPADDRWRIAAYIRVLQLEPERDARRCARRNQCGILDKDSADARNLGAGMCHRQHAAVGSAARKQGESEMTASDPVGTQIALAVAAPGIAAGWRSRDCCWRSSD